jgi:diguanylate cyclase (GGDEF)-like protein
VAVVLLDIDHFKSINDTHGHGVGDRALVAVAGALQGAMRQGDLVARYGGEEFVLLLLHCARLPGLGLAERLRAHVADLSLNDATGGAFSLTASLGVASSSDLGLDLATLLNQADAAMYRAKHRGRNQVDCLPNEEPEAEVPLALPTEQVAMLH